MEPFEWGFFYRCDEFKEQSHNMEYGILDTMLKGNSKGDLNELNNFEKKNQRYNRRCVYYHPGEVKKNNTC